MSPAGASAGRSRPGLAAAAIRSSARRSSGREPWNNWRAPRAPPISRLDRGNALQKLDEIFPGPGGEAPKAYAW